MSDDVSIEELKNRTTKGSRVKKAADAGEAEELKAAMLQALEDIEEGNASKTLSLRDERLAALVHGLEARPDAMQAVGEDFREALGDDTSGEIDRSGLLRLALRYAFREVAPEAVEATKEAQKERLDDLF